MKNNVRRAIIFACCLTTFTEPFVGSAFAQAQRGLHENGAFQLAHNSNKNGLIGFGVGFLLGLVSHSKSEQTPAESTEQMPDEASTPAPEERPAAPEYPTLDVNSYITAYQQGLADDGFIAQNVGSLSFSIERCSKQLHGRKRVVSARLEQPRFESGPLIDAILFQAAQYAWKQCPVEFIANGLPTGLFAFNLREVKIYMPDGTLAVTALRFHGDGATAPGNSYSWTSVRDLIADQRAVAAKQAAEAKAAEDARIEAARQARVDDFWFYGKLALALLAAVWLVLSRNMLARWFYSLTPHPAAGMVDAAIRTGAPLDGERFRTLTDDIPDGTPKMEVRAAQARALAEKWRRHEDSLNAKQADILAALRERLASENAFLSAQNELKSAATAHDLASARLDALRQSRT